MLEFEKNIASFHLAGIVPIAGQPLDFNFPWHDCCMPIGKDYLAVERAVLECAYAGCETIWVVCNDDMQPLIRYRLGDYVADPVWAFRKHDRHPSESRKDIPIFYLPIHPKDRDKRDCLAWSVLHGANSAFSISSQISKWVTPDKYYTAFPYGVYPLDFLREERRNISSENNFIVSFDNKTVRDNEYLGFTFGPSDFINIRKEFRQNATGIYKSCPAGEIPKEKLPLEERLSARFFDLKDVFQFLNVEGSRKVSCSWYHNIDNWESYSDYVGSSHQKSMIKPPKQILNYHEWNPMGKDN